MPTLVLQPDETSSVDTFIDQAVPTLNRGTLVSMNVGGATVIDRTKRLMVWFDLNSLTGATIVSATLSMLCTGEADTTDVVVGMHRAITEWFELGSTWNLRNTSGSVAWAGGAGGGAGSDYVALATATTLITGAGTFTWDVAADVAAIAAGTVTNYGWWGINASELTLGSNKVFASAGNATPANRPTLTVEYTLGEAADNADGVFNAPFVKVFRGALG